MPPTTNVFDTSDPSTYDTLSASDRQRNFAMISVERHQLLPTLSQRYATMQALQQPTPVQDGHNARFVLNVNLHVNSMAEALRHHASVYPLPTLYNTHQGRLPPITALSKVRVAIQRLLCSCARVTFEPDSNEQFSPDELNCLLQALLDGTIKTVLYWDRFYQLP